MRIPRGLWEAVFLPSAGVLPDGPGAPDSYGHSPAGRLLGTTTHGTPLPGGYRTPPYGAAMPPQGTGIPQNPYQHQPYVPLPPDRGRGSNSFGILDTLVRGGIPNDPPAAPVAPVAPPIRGPNP